MKKFIGQKLFGRKIVELAEERKLNQSRIKNIIDNNPLRLF